MSRISADDQLKFLLCCVKHANNGKIDFTEVARECAVVSRSAASKRYDRLLKANGIARNGISKSDAKPKKRNTDAIAKAAEEKRRKIEGDHNDPAADDDDIKRVAPKLEPGTDSMIKQEPGSGFPSFPYSSPFMQPQNAYMSGYIPTSTMTPTPGYFFNYSAVPDELSPQAQPMWQNSSRMFPRTAPSPRSTTEESQKEDSPGSFSTIPADCIKSEPTTEQTMLPWTAQSRRSEKARLQDAAAQPQQEDEIFNDFCKSDLFMPPIQHESTTSPFPSSVPQDEHTSRRVSTALLTAATAEVLVNKLPQHEGTSDQPEVIIIDD